MAKILEQTDRVNNIDALKSLMQRKGLSMRFLWVLLTKVKLKQARDLIMAAIIVRTMRRIVNEEVKIGSTIKKSSTSIGLLGNFGNSVAGQTVASSSIFRRPSHKKDTRESMTEAKQSTARAG